MNIRTRIESFPLVVVSKKIKKANALIPRHRQWAFYVMALILSDAVMTFCAFWTAYYLRFDLLANYFDPGGISVDIFGFLLYSMPVVWLVIFAAN
ncbi:MAG: hypothetical protein ACXW4U_03780, partial [Anaerolineales bacterium]